MPFPPWAPLGGSAGFSTWTKAGKIPGHARGFHSIKAPRQAQLTEHLGQVQVDRRLFITAIHSLLDV